MSDRLSLSCRTSSHQMNSSLILIHLWAFTPPRPLDLQKGALQKKIHDLVVDFASLRCVSHSKLQSIRVGVPVFVYA